MKKIGFLQKQVLVYSLLIMVAVLVLIFWAHSYVMDISREKAIVTQEQLTDAALEQVDNYLDHLMLIATQVAHDSEIIHIMEQLHTPENDPMENIFRTDMEMQERASGILVRHNQIKEPVYRIDIHNVSGEYICIDPTPENLQAGEAFAGQEWFHQFLQDAFIRDARDFIMMGPYPQVIFPSSVDENCIYMIMPIKNHDETEIYGYVEVYQSLEPLFEQLDLEKETGLDVYLFFEMNLVRGGQFYPPDQPFPDTTAEEYHETELQSNYGWFVVLLQNQKEFLASYQNMLIYLYLGGFALFALLFLCVYLLVRHTSKPILDLNSRVKEATLNNLPGLPVTEDALDEIKELEHSVERMMQRVKASVELEQRAYLKALQAQMNPHFLYNCLSTISSLGIEEESTTIPRFCSHLAAILRYESTYKNSLVTLADELRNARDYLELMAIRYETKLSYEIETDDTLDALLLPRLSLQPLVENCFTHGFKAVKPPWHVTIRAFREESRWVIQVCDNGIGFSDEKRQELQSQVEYLLKNLGAGYSELEIGGLGLASTIVRLKLMSAEQLSFAITSNEPTGTIITLRGECHD